MNKITVLIIEPEKEPYILEIENELIQMQKLVGGYIEAVYLDTDTVLICNEEGKLDGLKYNRWLDNINDMIVGTFFITNRDGDEFTSISDSNILKYTKLFRLLN